MSHPPKPQKSDRRRRLRKFAELSLLIPILGFALFLTPLVDAFTSEQGTPARPISVATYIFAVWAFLIIATLIISRLLAAHEAPE